MTPRPTYGRFLAGARALSTADGGNSSLRSTHSTASSGKDSMKRDAGFSST